MSNPTVKSLASDVAALQDGMAAILAAIQGNAPQADPEPETETTRTAKAGRRTNAAKATAAKAGLTRKLDPEVIETDDERVAFEVIASSPAAGLLRKGARVRVLVDGRPAKSLTGSVVSAIAEYADEIAAGIESVEKRAKIGAFLPEDE